jgi:hypothetical protein
MRRPSAGGSLGRTSPVVRDNCRTTERNLSPAAGEFERLITEHGPQNEMRIACFYNSNAAYGTTLQAPPAGSRSSAGKRIGLDFAIRQKSFVRIEIDTAQLR